MIGLCRGLAYQAHCYYNRLDVWERYSIKHPLFGIATREVIYMGFPISSRYYQLLDACRLRMRP